MEKPGATGLLAMGEGTGKEVYGREGGGARTAWGADGDLGVEDVFTEGGEVSGVGLVEGMS